MKILLNGAEILSNAEVEFFANGEFGWAVKMEFTDTAESEFNNVTEVHINYQSLNEQRIAIESYLHATGCTYSAERVKLITIVEATELETDF